MKRIYIEKAWWQMMIEQNFHEKKTMIFSPCRENLQMLSKSGRFRKHRKRRGHSKHPAP